MFRAEFTKDRGWRVIADYTRIGGTIVHVCLADDEATAQETARLMNIARVF